MLFIVVHQVYELWFKSLRHELRGVQLALEEGDTDRALHLLNRVLKILKTLVAQVDVLETMTPLQFLSFRDRLGFRVGLPVGRLSRDRGDAGLARALGGRRPAGGFRRHGGRSRRRSRRPSVWESFLGYLVERGHPVPDDAGLPDTRVQEVLIAAYRDDADAGAGRRAPGRSRRGHPGMALPARQDGRADDRHETRDRRLQRRRVPARDAVQAGVPGPLGDPLAAARGGLDEPATPPARRSRRTSAKTRPWRAARATCHRRAPTER